jgi:hypothetical protein
MINAASDTRPIPAVTERIPQALIAALEGEGRGASSSICVHARLSRLTDTRQRPAVAALLQTPLRDFAERRGARLFALGNGDVVMMVGASQDRQDLDQALSCLQHTIAAMHEADARSAPEDLFQIHEPACAAQRQELIAALGAADQAAETAWVERTPSRPVGCADLALLSERATPSLAARCLKRRTVLAIHAADRMAGLFEDCAADDTLWQPALDPGLRFEPHNPAARHLAGKMTTSTANALLQGLCDPPDIALGLGLPLNEPCWPVLTALLRRFAAGQLFVTVELCEALAAFDHYDRVRSAVQRSGNRLVLAAGPIGRVAFIDLKAMQADLISFDRGTGEASAGRELARAAAGQFGGERLILGAVEDELRLQRGMELGIRHFTGRYINRLAAKLRQKGMLVP